MSAAAEAPTRHETLDLADERLERPVALPDSPSQNGREAAFCLVGDGDSLRQVRFKGDPRIWEWSGVYEHLVRRLLRGNSPAALARLLQRHVVAAGGDPATLKAVALGAGNAWVADELQRCNLGEVVCVDASAAAAAAADRDHPDAFSDYLVLDMRRLSEAQRDQLMEFDFNTLVAVDPLAYEEPAPNAFTEAFNLLAPDGWIALHLCEDSVATDSDSRFARLVQQLISGGALDVVSRERYRHRFTTHGTPVYHVALVGRKVRDFDPGEPA